jgi:hypothetical protein
LIVQKGIDRVVCSLREIEWIKTTKFFFKIGLLPVYFLGCKQTIM